jgi:hypothetical protein
MTKGLFFCPRPPWPILRLGLALAACLGCAGYQIGNETLYRRDIQTVHVPVFESASFRPDLGMRLTEAVVKEIEAKTPYKVVGDQSADSILTGRIAKDHKRPLAENRNDFPRDIDVGFVLQVSWQDRRGNLIGQPVRFPLWPSLLSVSQGVHFVPEAGQSVTVAHQAAIERLAEQIVAQMETAW